MKTDASRPPRMLVIEGQLLFANALVQLLTMAGFDVVGSAVSLGDVQLGSLRPDLILIDVDGSYDVIRTICATRAAFPDIRICALSARREPDVMQWSQAAGVDGYLVTDMMPTDFQRAIRAIAAGEAYVDARPSQSEAHHPLGV